MVSCLASRSGTKSDSFAIDYQATLNCLETAKKGGVEHFVMLSAFCVKKPTLQVPTLLSSTVCDLLMTVAGRPTNKTPSVQYDREAILFSTTV